MAISIEKAKPVASLPLSYYAVILFLVEFVRGAYLVSFLPVYATEELGLSVSLVGLAVSVHYLTDNLVKSIAGYLLDRFSWRLIVNSGLLLAFAGLWLMVVGQSAWTIIAAAALLGIGGSPVWLVCLSTVDETKRASQMGVIYTAWLGGLGLGPVLINLLMDQSPRLAFWLMMAMWGLAWLLSTRLQPESKQPYAQIPMREQAAMLGKRLRKLGLLIPGMILQTMAAGMLVPILSSFATKQFGMSHTEYSIVLVVGGASTAVFLIPMGKWWDRSGSKQFLAGGFAFFAVALCALTLVRTFGGALILSVSLGICYAAVLPAWNALLARFIPQEQQGVNWGVFSSLEGLGAIIGPMIGGWLAAQYNESVTVWASALLLAGIALFYFWLPSSRFADEETLK